MNINRNDHEQAMDAALDYLASCTRDGIDWVELLRMRAAGVNTSEIDHWVREHRTSDDQGRNERPVSERQKHTQAG